MKKNNFIKGAFVATVGIVLCKILGLIYVIPFYEIIGTQGGALYSYAYSIYAVFLTLSTAGIPTAISKIVSEYNALGCKDLQERSYKIASRLLNGIGIVCFLILFLFSTSIAEMIIGGVEGGNTVENVSIAIKVVSLALLVVPQLSVLRGYYQGHKYITQSSISTVIEQLARVLVIILGSYITVKVFGLPIEYAVYLSVFGATIGALVSYIYLKFKLKKQKDTLEGQPASNESLSLSNKELLKRIIIYAIPFIIINLLQSAYSIVDTFTVVKTMTSLGYSTIDAETAIGVMNTWGSKLNMIVVSISLGLIVSLIPNVAGSYANKNFKDINLKINQSINMLLYVTLPMAIGISFLAEPVWNVFYGYNALSISLFRIFILQVVIYGLYTTLINIIQSMNETKISLGILLTSLILKLILNVPMMHLCYHFNIVAYYGPTITNAITEMIAVLVMLWLLKRKYDFQYKKVLVPMIKTITCVAVMVMVLSMLKIVYFNAQGIFNSIVTIAIFAIVGAGVYFIASYKLHLIENVFGNNFILNVKNRLSKYLKFLRKENNK